jgi:hypothetical protein
MEMQTMASQAAELKMPQAGGAQREPSMEEILASIRRIIEDSDQVRKPEDMLVVEPSARDAEPEPVEMIAANAPTSKFDLPRPARLAPEEPVARDMETAPMARKQATEPVHPMETPAARAPEPEDRVAEPQASDRMIEEHDTAPHVSMEVAEEPAVATTRADAAAAQPASAPTEKASLISERTGRQVAAAFGELSEAFEASRRKTFDELAAEMMRPMLQDWLDNNLPMLVEKLVREEIERVARGGR